MTAVFDIHLVAQYLLLMYANLWRFRLKIVPSHWIICMTHFSISFSYKHVRKFALWTAKNRISADGNDWAEMRDYSVRVEILLQSKSFPYFLRCFFVFLFSSSFFLALFSFCISFYFVCLLLPRFACFPIFVSSILPFFLPYSLSVQKFEWRVTWNSDI